jgi:DNA polymerase III subunit delta
MVKPAGASIERLLAAPPAELQVFVIFGPDTGLVRERANNLAAALLADPDDPFAVSRLSDEDIKADPAALADAMAALSLGGGDRLVRVRLAGDSAAVASWLAEFEAGETHAASLKRAISPKVQSCARRPRMQSARLPLPAMRTIPETCWRSRRRA